MASRSLHIALDSGLYIFPIGRKRKVPIIKYYPQRATNDLRLVEHWAKKWPGCNWAALTGELSDDLSIDIDGEVGRASLAEIERRVGPLPPTLSVRTGRADGGQQRHFLWPADRDLHSSAGKIAPGIDIRAKNGVAIIPDSIHPKTGILYAWENERERVMLPDSWVHVIDQDWQQRHAPKTKRDNHHFEPDAGAAPHGDQDANPRRYGFRALLPNHRTDGLVRYAGKLQRKGLPFERIQELLLAENLRRCRPPKPIGIVISIAQDIVARYPPADGPDVLQQAWSRLRFCAAATTAFKFRSLCIELQHSRPGLPVALPLGRIAELLTVDPTVVSRIRRRFVADGFLTLIDDYIPLERAQTFIVS
jgi:hypothetical protein